MDRIIRCIGYIKWNLHVANRAVGGSPSGLL
jgi:hypothetical protein